MRQKHPARSSAKKGKAKPQPQAKCTRCGGPQHAKEKCPAKEAVCHCCEKKGHFSKQCYTKLVSEISTENLMDTAAIDTVSSDTVAPWTAKYECSERRYLSSSILELM